MGSSSKKAKEKTDRKRRHRSRSPSEEYEAPKEKRHRHKKHHHKDRKREKAKQYEYESADSDVVEISPEREKSPTPPPQPPAPQTHHHHHHHRRETRERPSLDEHQPQQSHQSHQSQDSLSIDETNKLRAKLGLKPLQIGTETRHDDGKKKDDYGEFYHKPASNIAHAKKSEKIKSRLTEHKQKRQIESKLSKVKLLADSDGEEDISSWVQKNRKAVDAKKEAAKRAKMLEELDEQFGVSEVIEQEKRERARKQYSEKHLKGLRVDHDLDNFSEGKTVVLTLKDQGVLDEDDDVLINVNMIDDERYKKSNENKKKKLQYNPYDVEEFDEFGNPKPKSLLDKYDEEIDGEQREGFQIGTDAGIERKRMVLQNIKEKLANKRVEYLESTPLMLASEYYNEEELSKFKKPKKKLRKIRAKGKILSADDLEAAVNNTGIEDVGTRRPKKDTQHMDIDDIPSYDMNTDDVKLEEKDSALERALHKARKLKQREAVASNYMTDVVAHLKAEVKEEPADGGNIILNATAEFCRTLGDIPTYGRAGNREETEDILDFEKEPEPEDDDDCQIIESTGGSWNSVDPNYRQAPEASLPAEVPILDEEPDVGSGVGAALKLAMSKGYLDKEESNRPSNTRLAYLQAKHYSIEDKNYGDEGERGGRRERYAGPVSEFKERDGFKPNVKLEYIDDEGHVLNSKEAFRYLSHKFHGKGPGKNKIEKRIKKTQQEGLMKKMSSTDTPLGTLNMLQAKQKEMQSPYIVLSGGKTHSTSISKTRR